MLKEIYNSRREVIDEVIKTSLKKAEDKMIKIDYGSNKELLDKVEENCNIKMNFLCEDLYIQGLKDGINLMEECKKLP